MFRLQFNSLKLGAYSIVNIADVKIGKDVIPLKDMSIDAGKKAGFEMIEVLEFPLKNRLGKGMEDEVVTEPVIVFRKRIE